MTKRRFKKFLERTKRATVSTVFGYLVIFSVATTALTLILIQHTTLQYERALEEAILPPDIPAPFPVGVNPLTQEITELPAVETFYATQLAYEAPRTERSTWLGRIVARLERSTWFQNLASPSMRTLVIWSGDRREAVIDSFGDILRWDTAERATFATLVAETAPLLDEGKFFPGRYVVSKDTTPEEVAALVVNRFETEISSRYPESVAAQVPFTDALIIASLLEREAYDFTDMRYISGIIWNRLFTDMPLQIDATLQYVRGTTHPTEWWPVPRPADKFLESPFNTYQNNGLPPAPIGNPSPEAILAALNPRLTECMYYFHDANGGFHCTETYTEHVALLGEYY